MEIKFYDVEINYSLLLTKCVEEIKCISAITVYVVSI